MIDKRTIADPATRYGAGRPATRMFLLQRLTGALNIAFLIFFAWFVVSLGSADRAGMIDLVRNPIVAVVLVLLVINVAVHMRIGMREIIEDYLDEERSNRLGLLANDLFTLLIVIVGVGSIVKIVFWG
jgi:succinate dehydrogenase / fumarate reductase, membrane anchor subunit